MKKTVVIVLLPLFADWEAAFVSAALNNQIQNQESKYIVKTVGVSKDPIKSIGGLTVIPDYEIENIPMDYSALLLIDQLVKVNMNFKKNLKNIFRKRKLKKCITIKPFNCY